MNEQKKQKKRQFEWFLTKKMINDSKQYYIKIDS